MRKMILVGLVVVCLLLFCTPRVEAQQTEGTISGTVSDPTGAMIPRAQVTITNERTGLKRTVQANDAGFFTAPQLPVGLYMLSASATGFKIAENKGIDLHVREEKFVPMVLAVGAVTETVTVTGGATLVELRSGEVASLIGGQQVTELPLNGRSFVQLTLLVPGASVSDTTRVGNTGLLAGVDISMSGGPANTNAWLVDGVDNVDHGSGRTILVYPSVDSIEEFKVQRNSYGPEMAAASGSQINLVTKSGTNAFHGSAYEFLRNDKLNAANFFLNRGNAKKGKLRYNDFGYTVGGPIAKDKAFFFWSQEWRRELRGVTRKHTVPTLLERQGDFSGPHSGNWPTPVDPMTFIVDASGNKIAQPFPNNTILASRLSPAGLALMNLWPLPTNNNTVDNWVGASVTSIPTRQEQIRGDWNITQNHSVVVRYTQDSWANPAPNFAAEGGLWGDDGMDPVDSDWKQPSKLFAARLTSSLGPSMVNQFQFSYSNNRIFITRGVGESINADINSKIPEVFPGPDSRSHAVFWGAPLPNQPFNALWHAAPWDNSHDIYVWKDDFSKIQGNHTWKFGGLFSHNTKSEDCCGASNDQAQFWGPTAVGGGAGAGGGWGDSNAPGDGTGNVTRNGLADMLLKDAYWGSNEQSDMPRSKILWRDYEFYAADTWRAHPRLTLNYGVRYSYLPASYQWDDKYGNFIPSLYDPALGTQFDNGMIYPDNKRGIDVGRALRKDNHFDLAPRLGIAWDPTGAGKWAMRAGYGWFYGRSDLSQPIGQMVTNPPFNKTLSWGSGRPLDALPTPIPTAGVGTASGSADINWKTPGSYQWNFTLERELWQDTKVEFAYVGNRGHHIGINWDLNQVPAAQRLEYARRAFDGDSNTNEHALRPLFALRNDQQLIFQSNGGNSIYHGFQLFFSKRFSRNYSYQVSYSLSKLIAYTGLSCCQSGSEQGLSDAENAKYDRAVADFDRTHILSANVIYRFPELKDKNPAVRGLFGGWEGTGIYMASSGIPITVRLSSSLNGVRSNRPDLIGDPVGPRNAEQWFDPAAYVVPGELGRLGFSSRGSVRGPGINNVDLAIYKNFSLPREGWSIQFRSEFFNAFNHTQLLDVDANYQTSGMRGNLTTNTLGCGSDLNNLSRNCNSNAGFGKARRARDPRELQFALKFIF